MNYNNIFKVTNANDLSEILENNRDKIISVFYTTNECKNCRQFYPFFVQTSQETPDILFILINLDKFKDGTKSGFQFTNHIENVPHFVFYYDATPVFEFEGGSYKKFILTLEQIKKEIVSNVENKNEDQNKDNEEVHDKLSPVKEDPEQKKIEKEKLIDLLKFRMLKNQLMQINKLEQAQFYKQFQMVEHLKKIKEYKEKKENKEDD